MSPRPPTSPPTRRRQVLGEPIRRLLVANRGEIAVRIIRACRDLRIETVLVHSEADRDSLAVRFADRAVCIGSAHPPSSYLNVAAILVAATALHVDAIHLGYGFLAENPKFVAACEAEGIRFVGPGPRAMELIAQGELLCDRRLEPLAGSDRPIEDAGVGDTSVTPGSGCG